MTSGRLIWSTGISPRPDRISCGWPTYVATFAGVVYVAFVFDVFSRRIVSWRAATTMTTDLVLDTPEMAIWTRGRGRVLDLSGLIHHTSAGSQYTSFAFTSRIIEAGVDASVGSVAPTTTPWWSHRSASTRPS